MRLAGRLPRQLRNHALSMEIKRPRLPEWRNHRKPDPLSTKHGIAMDGLKCNNYAIGMVISGSQSYSA